MKKIILLCLTLTMFNLSFGEKDVKEKKEKLSYKFNLGVMAGRSTRLYKTNDHKISYVPIVGGEIGNFYLLGTELGYRKHINKKLTLTGFTQLFGGLALQGLGGELGGKTLKSSDMKDGYNGIEDRKNQIEVGLRLEYLTENKIKLMGEVRGGEIGGTVKGSILKPFMVTRRFVMIPQLNITLINKNIADYYFGVTDLESKNSKSWKIKEKYEVDNITVATSIGLAGSYYITRKLSIFLLTEVQYVGDEISNSPIIDTNVNYYVGTGLRYAF